MKPVKAWAVVHKQGGEPIGVRLGMKHHALVAWCEYVNASLSEFRELGWRLVRVEIRELPPKARKGTRR